MNLTRTEAVALFREHWSWLADTGSANKVKFIEQKGHEEVRAACYLCQYVNDQGEGCDACPIDWPQKTSHRTVPCFNSLYQDWVCASTRGGRQTIARAISELPEKEGGRVNVDSNKSCL